MEHIPSLAPMLLGREDIDKKPMNFPLLLDWANLYKERPNNKYKASTEQYMKLLTNLSDVSVRFLNPFFLVYLELMHIFFSFSCI